MKNYITWLLRSRFAFSDPIFENDIRYSVFYKYDLTQKFVKYGIHYIIKQNNHDWKMNWKFQLQQALALRIVQLKWCEAKNVSGGEYWAAFLHVVQPLNL